MGKTSSARSRSCVISVVASAGFCLAVAVGPSLLADDGRERVRGVWYVSWSTPTRLLSEESDATLASLPELGVNWVALRVTWYQTGFDTPSVYPGVFTPTDDALSHAVRHIHALGMKTMLGLQIDLCDPTGSDWRPGGKWHGQIEFPSEHLWTAWFDAYGQYVLHYAELCRKCGVDMLCIGVELVLPATTHEQQWRDLITKVRAVYPGPLTYQANWSPLSYNAPPAVLMQEGKWNAEYRAVKFWDALDHASLCCYFPLSGNPDPSEDDLCTSWQPWLEDLRRWQEGIGRPVLLGEAGYHSCDGAAVRVYEHEKPGPRNVALQSRCYESLLKTFWKEPWVVGVFWWFACPRGEWGVDKEGKGFPFLGKPAEEVLRRWFTAGGEKP